MYYDIMLYYITQYDGSVHAMKHPSFTFLPDLVIFYSLME